MLTSKQSERIDEVNGDDKDGIHNALVVHTTPGIDVVKETIREILNVFLGEPKGMGGTDGGPAS